MSASGDFGVLFVEADLLMPPTVTREGGDGDLRLAKEGVEVEEERGEGGFISLKELAFSSYFEWMFKAGAGGGLFRC